MKWEASNARTRELKLAVSKKIRRNPLRSMKKLAREHGVSNSAMHLLKVTVCKPAKAQMLMGKMKAPTRKMPLDEAAEPQ